MSLKRRIRTEGDYSFARLKRTQQLAYARFGPSRGQTRGGFNTGHRAQCPASTSINGGNSTAHFSMRNAQRGSNRHPAEIVPIDGTAPLMVASGRSRSVASVGIECSNL